MHEPDAPYLIQRALIPCRASPEATLSEAIALEYMGHAEFEFGTLPGSLKALNVRANGDGSVLRAHALAEILDRHGQPLRLLGLPERDVAAYNALLRPVIEGHARTLARPGFQDAMQPIAAFPAFHPIRRAAKIRKKDERKSELAQAELRCTRFWWDLGNHVMMSFDADLMQRLPGHLAASWTKMGLPLPVPDSSVSPPGLVP